MPPQGRFRQPCLGLESDVGAELKDTRAAIIVRGDVGKAHWTGCADARIGYKATRSAPVLMVEQIQCFGLEGKPKSLGYRDCFRERLVVIPNVRPIEPGVVTQGSRRGVLTDAG